MDTRAIKAANEIMETLEDVYVFEGLCSRMEGLSLQNQKIELAVPEDKIEEEITQTLEYTDDLMGQKNKIAKFLRDAKAQVKQEQEEKRSRRALDLQRRKKRFMLNYRKLH